MESTAGSRHRQTLRGATLVTAHDERRADLTIEDGRIAHIGGDGLIGEEVDVSGLLILPGMVDTHVHLMDPGDVTREDFPTGTAAAAARGVTTIIEHTHSHPIRSVTDLEEKRHHLEGRSHVDFGLAAHVWPDLIPEIPRLREAGISFFKIFTCDTHGVPGLDTQNLLDSLQTIAAVDGRCLIHNEDQIITAAAERRLRAEHRLDPGLLVEWRSREAELVAAAATAAVALHAGAAVSFAHVSNTAVLDVIDAFRRLGADLAAEACPQYFALHEEEVATHGTFRKFTPPARIRDEGDRKRMWRAVNDGRFSFFSTDHAPSTVAQKTGADIWEAPFGLPGLDTTLPFLVDAALQGRLSLSDVARLYAAEPARRYRLDKGEIRVGADADLVLVDPETTWTVHSDDIVSKAGWSPYEGASLRGRVVAAYLRGVEIARDGVCHTEPRGRFIHPVG